MIFELEGVTAIYGRPGVGKTSLAMRIAHERLRRGDKVLWISLYEDKETFLRNAASLGYDLSKADFWDMIFVKPDVLMNQLVSAVSQEDYKLVVADSISSMLEGSRSREYLINAVYRVFKPAKIDFIAIAEEESVTPLDYIADNLLRLELMFVNGVAERRMYVLKSRGKPAGYYTEFDIIQGQGVIFLDDLPKPPQRPSWRASAESILQALGEIKGGNAYLFVGSAATPLLAKLAAELAQGKLKVLYRTTRDTEVISSLIERHGGKAHVVKAEPRPLSHFAHLKSLYESLADTGADVVISDGVIDLEFILFGKKALEINRMEIGEIKKSGAAAVLAASRDWGLRYIVDTAVKLSGDTAVVYTPQGVKRCKLDPAPRLLCV